MKFLLVSALAVRSLSSCNIPDSSLKVGTNREALAANCEAGGKCLKEPKGLIKYNPDVVTETGVIKQSESMDSSSGRMNLVGDRELLLISEKIQPLIR